MRLSTSLMSLWQLREHYVEGHSWLRAFLAEGHEFLVVLRARALLLQGLLLMRHANDPAGAAPLFDQALELYRESGRLGMVSETLQAQGDLALKQRNIPAALDRFTESLRVAREAGHAYMAHRACVRLA